MTTSAAAPAELFERYRDDVDAALRAVFEGLDSPLATMARYQLGWVDADGHPVQANRGKALRPTLCLLTCEALGGDVEAALPAAAGVELLHNFSLVHDDVMDNDLLRRHRPTVWAVWGEAKAIDAGDFMHVLATLSVLRAGTSDDAQAARDAVEVLTLGCRRMTEGQYLDMAYEDEDAVSVDDYLRMIDLKTAALIGTSMELGAVFAGNDPSVRTAVREAGTALGAAFQIRDDFLGIWGDPDATGKSVESDIQKRKKTLPIVHAMTEGAPADRDRLRTALADLEVPPDTAEIVALLERSGSRAYAESLAEEYHAQTRDLLSEAPLSAWGAEALGALAAFTARRTV